MKKTTRSPVGYVFIVSVLFLLLSVNMQRDLLAQDTGKYFKIQVVDDQTGRGVPLVALRTRSDITYYTDSNGIIAFCEPSLMNQTVCFSVFSHGYESTKDGTDRRVVTLTTTPGDSAIVKTKRINIAERLYRITGQDIYGESARLGLPIPIRHQDMNGKVLGQDTFIETLYKGRIYWFWGDTEGPAHWNGHVSGATSELPGKGGLDPGVGIDLTYFVGPSGFCKAMCPFPGPGLVWIDWLITLPDEKGNERLYAKYARVKTDFGSYERGLAVFNDSTAAFDRVKQIEEWLDRNHQSGHPLRVRSNATEYFYVIDRQGIERVQADITHLTNPLSYEHFTCIAPGTKYDSAVTKLNRSGSGKLVYAWKANTDALNPERQDELMASGRITNDEALWQTRNVENGTPLSAWPASVSWNDFRKRWVMIAYEFCGGAWFFEGDTPTGPWVYGRKIVHHNHYDFYNLGQHPLFDQEGGRLIYFEGTYTTGFSGNTDPTPLYDYNQMMYRLALDDKRLSLPAPVYRVKDEHGTERYLMREAVDSLNLWEGIQEIPFFAIPPDRQTDEHVLIFALQERAGERLTGEHRRGSRSISFCALPTDLKSLIERDPISGTWQCRANAPDSLQMDFTLELRLDGEQVTGSGISQGRYRKNSHTLSFILDDNSATARLSEGKLQGEYVKVDGREAGTWSGEFIGHPPEERISSDVVLLYEYRRVNSGRRFYSVDQNLETASVKRTPEPICRVWRNPSSVLALDYEAKPVRYIR
jgi:hypothetical protein